MNEYFMKMAIDLALKGSGFVNPDPLSGAVIVKEGKLVGEGYYKYRGGKSAEMEALSSSSMDFSEASMYINIEPFCNEEEGNLLMESLRLSGVKVIYIGILNPNPNKKFDFISELQKNHIKYEVGVLEEACRELNEIYIHYSRNKRPFVVVKWAMTLDGKLATRTGDSKWISSEDSLRFVHQLRQRVAAIMVGENTVKVDDPLLTTRLDGVAISNPIRIILSKYGDVPIDSKVLKVDESKQTILIASERIKRDKEEMFTNRGVPVVKLKEVNGHIPFADIMQVLGEMEIDSLYIEGGSAVLASAFESGCIHKVYTAIAPKIVGGKEAFTPVGGKGIERMGDAIVLHHVSHEIVGPDVIVKGYIHPHET